MAQNQCYKPSGVCGGEGSATPVLVFGELHGTKDYLDFLNELLPVVYKRAGVTVLAMEVCLAEDNSELERLVTGATFDRDLALKLARHEPWGTWGFKEYWDVLETVWRLNQAIPPNQKRMRLIGWNPASTNSPWP
jgi:hypothetical protein